MERLFGVDNLALIARLLSLVLAIPIHELAHGWVSDKMGDHTAREMGRLTLNPIRHIDPFGFLAMIFIGVGWAKPVPVNPNFYKNRKLGMAATAFAGPLANLLLALLTVIIYRIFGNACIVWLVSQGAGEWPYWMEAVQWVLYFFALINITLALFNLIPIPPLDGSRILGLVLPERIYFGIMRYERYILFGLLAVMFLLPRVTGFSPISWLLGDATDAVMAAFLRLTAFIDTLFGL